MTIPLSTSIHREWRLISLLGRRRPFPVLTLWLSIFNSTITPCARYITCFRRPVSPTAPLERSCSCHFRLERRTHTTFGLPLCLYTNALHQRNRENPTLFRDLFVHISARLPASDIAINHVRAFRTQARPASPSRQHLDSRRADVFYSWARTSYPDIRSLQKHRIFEGSVASNQDRRFARYYYRYGDLGNLSRGPFESHGHTTCLHWMDGNR